MSLTIAYIPIRERNEIEETLVHLFLRLNGYFTSGFIPHQPDQGIRTQIDVMAVRFPMNKEPEREILPCTDLLIPSDKIDFIIGEVKNTDDPAMFNEDTLMSDVENMKYLFRWMGAFTEEEINEGTQKLFDAIKLNKQEIPIVRFSAESKNVSISSSAQVRALLFDLNPEHKDDKRCIHGSTIMNYLWECFRPDKRRSECADRYDFDAWGLLYSPIVRYFKDRTNHKPGTALDLVEWVKNNYPTPQGRIDVVIEKIKSIQKK